MYFSMSYHILKERKKEFFKREKVPHVFNISFDKDSELLVLIY